MSKPHLTPLPPAGSSAGAPALDPFDHTLAALIGRPDVVSTKPSTKQIVPPLGIGGVATFNVRTFRELVDGQASRDAIFLECYDAKGATRLMLPPEVADVIARQREALTAKSKSRASRKTAADRKARGEAPAFLKGRS
jgi:hypothetical protein